ncbi:multiubiquitin domain-containing protein [Fimbriiglobus ruber]|uniref:Multi-ubiquitin domain-containing protein n=1 Tax=Fimbriiglobus ruber TaxID=1908690 RepID=A0A225DXY5_9BACT|nr:multiubiquitin domain-containing protein [Fimbriiglobus ruber]OWK40977.1 hypothetical protein FRUB_04869 [Fimbriiglobus ruber]
MDRNEDERGGAIPTEEGALLEEVEIEEYAKKNHRPPRAKRYVIRIDKVKFTVHVSHMTGRELLKLAGKTPPENYSISQKLHGGHVKPIGLDQDVDFTCQGVERFMTLPLDQTEG